jgi:hypothetical protein
MKQGSISPQVLVFSMGMAAVMLAIGFLLSRQARIPSSGEAAPALSKTSKASAPKSQENSELRALSAEQIASAPPPPVVVHSATRPASEAASAPARVEATPYTRDLVAGLAQLDLGSGKITQEQADQWKQALQTLTVQGAAAVPAIRDFLEKNLEFNFAGVEGGQWLGQPSLRTALLNALQEIGGPEATDLMLHTLRTSALPSEIALLAQRLEQQSPGQYRLETLEAANQVLAMAAKGELTGWDVAPLFQVLSTYGDASTAANLQQLQSQWRYYATMALAGLEGGEGIPVLVRQVQEPTAGAKRNLAFQMLAQQAPTHPDASAALIEQARLNKIPDSAWRGITAGLAGDQYYLGTQQPGSLPGLKTYHLASGNQSFYSLPVAADGQVAQRNGLIDQLLAATSNQAALTSLQNARATLSAGLRH